MEHIKTDAIMCCHLKGILACLRGITVLVLPG